MYGKVVQVIGFPGDEDKFGNAYSASGNIAEINRSFVAGFSISYELPTSSGQSGGGVFPTNPSDFESLMTEETNVAMIGIHTGAIKGNPKQNQGTLFTTEIKKWILKKIQKKESGLRPQVQEESKENLRS